MALHVTLQGNYRSNKGNVTYRYFVKGSKTELESFEKAQGEFHRVDDETGTPLWFTTRCIGKSGKLIITTNGKVVPDMSEFDQAASLASQYGGNFGQELARAAAQRLIGGNRTVDTDTESDD